MVYGGNVKGQQVNPDVYDCIRDTSTSGTGMIELPNVYFSFS